MKKELIIIITIIILLNMVYANTEKQIIAHRKNTIQEIEQSLEKFVKTNQEPVIEIDVRKQNNEFIAAHNKNPKNITTIKEIIKQFKNKTKFHFDLKEKAWEIEFVNFLLTELKPNQFTITSKYIDSLKKIKNKNPEINLGQVITKGGPINFIKNWVKSRYKPQSLIKCAIENNFTILLEQKFVNKKLLKIAEQKNLEIMPWTVNSKSKINQLSQQKQVVAIVSDF